MFPIYLLLSCYEGNTWLTQPWLGWSRDCSSLVSPVLSSRGPQTSPPTYQPRYRVTLQLVQLPNAQEAPTWIIQSTEVKVGCCFVWLALVFLLTLTSNKSKRKFLPREAGPAEFPWLQHHSDQAAATQGEYGGVCPICLACWTGCRIQSPGGSSLHRSSQERHYPCPSLVYEKGHKPPDMLTPSKAPLGSDNSYHKAHGTAGTLDWCFSY